ncbi:hypothetical protein Pmani_027948 [Petrolisthes manimaculis]|uniref:C2H2-type domain-containing protein n=1 Tax=Petrolisthes manimaculis TaxID=1843537 RepID=A0AAE1P2H3_9EUCA|nr:hypothetical protein Pmani_027948 [Petrolisthes manimaculis]
MSLNHYAIPIYNTTFSVDVMESWNEEEPPDLSQFLAVSLEEGGGADVTLPPPTKEEEATDSGLVRVAGNAQCPVCFKEFKTRRRMLAHLKIHTGVRKHECDVCFKRFSRTDKLVVHKRTHTGERPFQCFCGKRFTRIDHLKTHSNTHGSTPKVMPTVVESKSNKKSVRSTRLSERKILICSYCDQKFTQSYKYHRHVRTHTGEKPYHCMCGAQYSRSERLRKHLLENPEHVQASPTSFGEDLGDCVANISTHISTDTPALPDCLNGDDNDCENKRQSTGVTNEMEMYTQLITTSPSDTKKDNIQEDNRVIDSLMQNVTQQEDTHMDTTQDDKIQKDDSQRNETQPDYVQRDEAQEYETWEDGSQQDDVQREETQQDNTQRDETEQINTQKDGFLMVNNKVKDMLLTGGLVVGSGKTQCPLCFKEFTRRRRMLTHLQTHTGDRPHECDICLKRFTRSDKLLAHKRTHTRERPYHCFCGIIFTHVDDLKAHLTTHGLTPDQVMPTVVELKSKKKRMSERKILICSYCDQKFTESYKYHRHVRTHTGEKPYHCMCGAQYSRSEALRKHLLENPEHVQASPTSFGEDLGDCVANISTHISTDTPALPDCLNGDDNDCENKRQSTGVTNEMEMYTQLITTSPSDTKKDNIQEDNRVIDSLMQNVTQQEDTHMDTTQDDETSGYRSQHDDTQIDRTQQTNVHRDETEQFDVQREETPQDSSQGDNIPKNVNRVKGVEKTGNLVVGKGKNICPLCFKEFTRRRRMLIHLRAHTGERPHECDICFKRFTRSDKLVDHKRTHTGERPYQCFCGKRFTRVDHLKTHTTTHGLTPNVMPTVVEPKSNN